MDIEYDYKRNDWGYVQLYELARWLEVYWRWSIINDG